MKPLLLFFVFFFRRYAAWHTGGADLDSAFILRVLKCVAAETFTPESIFFLFTA